MELRRNSKMVQFSSCSSSDMIKLGLNRYSEFMASFFFFCVFVLHLLNFLLVISHSLAG